MKNAWCFRLSATRFAISLLILGAALLAPAPLLAGAPEWLRAAARVTLPSYPPETAAVILLDEQVTTVTESGEIKTVYRRAYKILRPQGREHASFGVYFDEETRLTFLKAWAIPAQGAEYEVKEKEAVESTPFSGALYEGTRVKVLKIPAADPGNVIGYEYERKRRPYVWQDMWWLQHDVPVRMARFILSLPKGWGYESVWLNHAAREPRASGENQWIWEVEDIPHIEEEPSMPHIRSVAGRMAVTFFSREGRSQAQSHSSWSDVGRWYFQLAASRRNSSMEIKQKVAELTAGVSDPLEKLERLAAFAQRDIRYVAIEIGIGGFQPHAASEIFTNRYGDCKDKVNLLSVMLSEIGIESHYVLLHSDRGAVAENFPSMMNFNHVILAIRVPPDVPTQKLHAMTEHPRLGRLLFFDPTDDLTPLGYLPPPEQASHGLLVTSEGGELLKLPLLPAAANRLLRTAKFSLSASGVLSGEVQEIRWGSPATYRRARLLESTVTDRQKVLEGFLADFLPGFRLTAATVDNLERYGDNLVLNYRFVAENYAQAVGNLLLLRVRVLGEKGSDLLERKPRKYPVEFEDATLQTDQFEFTLPPGFQVDELPPPTEVAAEFGEYRSKVEVQGQTLRYTRTYQVKDVLVPTAKLEELKKFNRRVAADERASAVLKRSGY